MQFNPKDFNEKDHDRFKALSVMQPFATNLVTPSHIENGNRLAVKSIEVRSHATKYRGDILICSTQKPEVYGLESGVSIGLVEIYDVKPCSKFTAQDWENTTIPEKDRHKFKNGFGWLCRNPRRVIEYPVKGNLGIFNLIYTKGDIIPYPVNVKMDKESFKLATSKK